MYTDLEPNFTSFFGCLTFHFMGQIFQNMGPNLGSRDTRMIFDIGMGNKTNHDETKGYVFVARSGRLFGT